MKTNRFICEKCGCAFYASARPKHCPRCRQKIGVFTQESDRIKPKKTIQDVSKVEFLRWIFGNFDVPSRKASEIMGISQKTIYAMLQGKIGIDLKYIERLCKYVGIKIVFEVSLRERYRLKDDKQPKE